jgi:hypothetical protein
MVIADRHHPRMVEMANADDFSKYAGKVMLTQVE